MITSLKESELRARLKEVNQALAEIEDRAKSARKKLRDAADAAEAARVKAMEARAKLDEIRGGKVFFDLKKEKGAICTLLSSGRFIKDDPVPEQVN